MLTIIIYINKTKPFLMLYKKNNAKKSKGYPLTLEKRDKSLGEK